MGLAVKVYKNIKKIDQNSDDHDFIAYVDHHTWKDHIKNLEEGAKYVGECHGTDVGYSYSTHTWFRNKLMSLVLDKEIDKFYEHIDSNLDMPFIEFINFSDCEGCIDWETSAKLCQDFIDWKERVIEEFPIKPVNIENKLFVQRYEAWMEVFELAKDNGVVVY